MSKREDSEFNENELGLFLMENRGSIPLRTVAENTGISHTYIADLEKGINRKTNNKISPSPHTLKSLSTFYGCDYYKLMELAGHINLKDFNYKESVEDITVSASKYLTETELNIFLLLMRKIKEADTKE